MMKKWFGRALLLVLALCLACTGAMAEGSYGGSNGGTADENAITSGDYQYVLLEDGTAKIVSYSGNSGDRLNVADQLDGHPVTTIGQRAFYDFGGRLSLPDSVTTLEDEAFANKYITGMEQVIVPASVKEIYGNPFYDCITYAKAYTYSSSGDFSEYGFRIVNGSFYSDTKGIYISSDSPYLEVVNGAILSKLDRRLIFVPQLEEAFAIPEGTQIIGMKAFYDSNIKNVTIPDSVQVIEENAFRSCDALIDIALPDSLTIIGDYAFWKCRSLASVTIPGGVTYIGEGAFWECRDLTNVSFLDGVTSIGELAFADCPNLTSVTIPDSVTSFGEYAFAGCSKLASITIPASVTSIGRDALADCSSSLTVTVTRDSYAEQYCKDNSLKYQYAE